MFLSSRQSDIAKSILLQTADNKKNYLVPVRVDQWSAALTFGADVCLIMASQQRAAVQTANAILDDVTQPSRVEKRIEKERVIIIHPETDVLVLLWKAE